MAQNYASPQPQRPGMGMPGLAQPVPPQYAAPFQPPYPQAMAYPQAPVDASNDIFDKGEIMPGLMPFSVPEAAAAAAAGLVVGNAFQQFIAKEGVTRLAETVDKWPGVSQVSKYLSDLKLPDFIEKRIAERSWVQDWRRSSNFYLGDAAVGAASGVDARVAASMAAMEEHKVLGIVDAYADKAKKLGRLKNASESVQATKTAYETVEKEVKKLLSEKVVKDGKTFSAFESLSEYAAKEIETIESAGLSASRNNPTYQAWRAVRDRVGSFQDFYAPTFKTQATLFHKLEKKGVGRIGQTVARGFGYLSEVFGGDVLKAGVIEGGQEGLMGFLKKHGPMMFVGLFSFGSAIHKMRGAKEGEKISTFNHEFWGMGVGNMLGWTMGRSLLNSSNIMGKILGSAQGWRPLKLLGGWLPFIGENFGKMVTEAFGKNMLSEGLGTLMGRGLGGMLGSVTLAGFATEIIAMFVFGTAVQKLFEWGSHKIFGKPSEESLEPEKAKLQQQQMPPQMFGMPGGGMNLAMGVPPMAAAQASAFQRPQMAPAPISAFPQPQMAYSQPQASMARPGQAPNNAFQSPMAMPPQGMPAQQAAPAANNSSFLNITPEQIQQSELWKQSENLLNQMNAINSGQR